MNTMLPLFDDPSSAYLGILDTLVNRYEFVSSPRGMKIYELMNYGFIIENPDANPIVTLDPERNKKLAAYTASEHELYTSCSNQASDFAAKAKFWDTIKNPDGTINSAYGHLIWADKSCGHPVFEGVMRTPWEWAVHALCTDHDTRQAMIKFHRRQDLWVGNRDVVCTMHGIFHIRKGKLNLSVVMRSQDVVKGLAFDAPFFCSLLPKMVDELRGKGVDVEVGRYHHYVHSLHLYARDLPVAHRMLGLPEPVAQ